MDKPTHKEIIDMVKATQYRKPSHIAELDCILSFSIYYRYAVDARPIADKINNMYGQWVHASVFKAFDREYSVHIGYRSIELSKCDFCGWLDGLHSDYCKRPLTK